MVSPGSEILDVDYHFYCEVEVDNLAIGITGYVFLGLIHRTDDFFGVVFGNENGEVSRKFLFFSSEIVELGQREVVDEVFTDETLGVVIKLDLLFASESGEIVGPFFQFFYVALVSTAHQGDEVVKKHPRGACGVE